MRGIMDKVRSEWEQHKNESYHGRVEGRKEGSECGEEINERYKEWKGRRMGGEWMRRADSWKDKCAWGKAEGKGSAWWEGWTLYKEDITGSLQSVLLLWCSVPSAHHYDERLQLLILMDRSRSCRSCPHMASSKGRDKTFRGREL